jgi:diguanylate cyclase (GGDEF)-like protein
MNIVAITQHQDLVDRVNAAAQETGHLVRTIPDTLQALALEAWKDAQVILVDAAGDPLDGIRFSHFLRGKSEYLFQDLPIILIIAEPFADMDPQVLANTDVDGFLHADDGLPRVLAVLGPALEGHRTQRDPVRVPVASTGLTSALADRIRSQIGPSGFDLIECAEPGLSSRISELQAPLLLMGLQPSGRQALTVLRSLRERPDRPYVILIGRPPLAALQRELLQAGGMDWISLPCSGPLLLHACRKGLECMHVKRVHREFMAQINDLRELRTTLERETSSLRSEVLTDSLTGLLNRRAFNQNLEFAINQWVRHHRPFVLIFGDIDYFKLINDRFGHMVGDQVLKILSDRIRGSLRRSDLAFRIGGEEFAIILMETSLQAGAEVADKLRRKIDENPIHLETGQTIFPTLSFGVGVPGDRDSSAFCVIVDEALYVAKHKGRNRIEVVPEQLPAIQ